MTKDNYGIPISPEEFWAKTLRVGPCLEWQGARGKQYGYGIVMVLRKHWLAHRYAWTLRHGPIPPGLLVLHTCDNPPCVEPLHLFLGTHQDNMRDRSAKGRDSLSGRHQDHENNHNARLTWAQVAEIRALYAEGLRPKQIAPRYSVSHQHISRIVRGERWSRAA